MQDVTLPYWFIWVGSTFGAGIIAWAVYQNRITQENKEAIIRIGTIKEEITQLGERLDKFLASELNFLKSKI
jgi:hypothetical protein